MSTAEKPLPPLQQIPSDIAAVTDYERYAQARVPPAAWQYLNGASADGITAADNVAAYQRIRLRNRVLRPLQDGHTHIELFGDTFKAPILVAPMAYQQLAHADGEEAMALGAAAIGLGMVVSTQASIPLETLAQTAQGPLWFQLYIQPDRAFTLQLLNRAVQAGYRAIVLTVDAPVSGLRNQEQRAGFVLPPQVRAVNLEGMQVPPRRAAGAGESAVFGSGLIDYAPTWEDAAWLIRHSPLPVLLKGIQHPDDARLALDAGAAGLIVSNHGGRTLDTLPATLDTLPEVAAAVQGRVPVLLDGGIRRGSDILKALALGANAVLVGRPAMHGLAAAGATGVAHVLHLLRSELEVSMALAGFRRLADIDRACILT